MSRLGEFANIYELLDESDASGVETGKKASVALAEKKAAAAAALAPSQPNRPAGAQSGKSQGQRPAGEQRQGGFSGERGPRTDRPRDDRPRSDRPPRTDRPRDDRPRGDRPPRGPRPEGSPKLEGGENTFTGEGQPTAAGAPRPYLPRDRKAGPRPDRGYERRNPADQDQRSKREFDRRSGTGRGKEVAKGGAGKGGWGSLEDEAAAGLEGDAAKAAETESKQEGEETTIEGPPAAEVTEGQAAAAPEDDEPKTRTLEDYLKEKQSKQTAALPAPRQAGEGETQAWEKYETFSRKEDILFAVDQKTKKREAKEKDSTEKKVAADQVLKFQQERRERPERQDRDRPDRGDRRGGSAPRGGDRGAPRGGAGNQGGQKRGTSGPALKFDDANAFPTLSTKA